MEKRTFNQIFKQMLNCITIMFKQMLNRATIVSPTSFAWRRRLFSWQEDLVSQLQDIPRDVILSVEPMVVETKSGGCFFCKINIFPTF
jgi:hypothetical protein